MTDDPQNATPPEDDLPEQMRVRREKRERLVEEGVARLPRRRRADPHAGARSGRRTTAQELEPDTRTGEQVAVTGRVIFLRNTGKLCFVRLREGDGTELQVMLSLADVGEESLGRVQGAGRPRRPARRARRGDHQPPRRAVGAGHRLVDRRQDAAPAAQRAQAALRRGPGPAALRRHDRPPGAPRRWCAPRPRCSRACAAPSTSAASSRSRRRSCSSPTAARRRGRSAPTSTPSTRTMLLRIALELDLKRAMIGGVDRVYEIGRTFRNEGLDSTHAAEFSMLEAYEAYGDQRHDDGRWPRPWSVDAHRAIGSRTVVPAATAPRSTSTASGARRRSSTWSPRRSATTVDADTDADDAARATPTSTTSSCRPRWDAGEIVVELFEQLVEDTLIQPTFVMDYPESVKPLAKPHRSTPGLNEAWDLIINGVELGAAYSELNDPVIQRERLEEQSLLAAGRATPRRWSSTRSSSRRWSTACRRPAASGIGRRPAGHAAHRRRHPRDDPVPAAAPRVAPIGPDRFRENGVAEALSGPIPALRSVRHVGCRARCARIAIVR